jgi:gamma-glutamylcyclotransferase (GGCT)/AIG2-like uncharacterized protein YtfP
MDADAPARVKIFVYGTLLRGESAHHLLGRALFLGSAHTTPSFTLLDMGEYPALIEGGSDRVAGEIYAIEAALLPALDAYEEAPSVYERKSISIGGHNALAYVLRGSHGLRGARIASGHWRER